MLIGLVGVCIVAYPTVSDHWNARVQSRAITAYQRVVSDASDEAIGRARAAAALYNQALFDTQQRGVPTGEVLSAYDDTLNLGGDGIMGYLVIPSIDVRLPIYHGTSDEVLQTAAGHVASSSLPLGGASTHAVLLGHRGLPSARLFTDLDQLERGDYFELHVLNDVLYYKVYDIRIVEPVEMNDLRVEVGRDMVTLATCTPYGVNTHRLLIMGERMPEPEKAATVYADARKVSNVQAALWVGVVLWVLVMIVLVVVSARHRRHAIGFEERRRRRRILKKRQK